MIEIEAEKGRKSGPESQIKSQQTNGKPMGERGEGGDESNMKG